MEYTEFKKLIRQERQAKGWSQRELGRRAGYTQGHICYIENQAEKRKGLNLAVIIKVIKALGLELSVKSVGVVND